MATPPVDRPIAGDVRSPEGTGRADCKAGAVGWRVVGAKNSAVTVQRVHVLVWGRALGLATGDARRIQVINERTVMVHNARVR